MVIERNRAMRKSAVKFTVLLAAVMILSGCNAAENSSVVISEPAVGGTEETIFSPADDSAESVSAPATDETSFETEEETTDDGYVVNNPVGTEQGDYTVGGYASTKADSKI